MSVFSQALTETMDQEAKKVHALTENGAVAQKTSGKALLDLNFALSSMRNMPDDKIWSMFLAAYNEDPVYAMVWLYFSRDPRGGMGERDTFRTIMARMADENPNLIKKLLPLVPEYGRWDDLIWVMDHILSKTVQNAIKSLIYEQFKADMAALKANKPVSLLGKWLPSNNASSKDTLRRAEILRSEFGLTPRQYRKALVALRERIAIVESKMSANEWAEIAYPAVPSRAMMNYRDAFRRHDEERYNAYLTNVKEGKEKINSGVLFPHDIVHAYHVAGWRVKANVDNTLEEQWKALPNPIADKPESSTLVVVDGSGSMSSPIGNTNISALEVARAIGLFFAERIEGEFNNTFITFSSHPELVRLHPDFSLHAKLQVMDNYDDCSNTDIEKVFGLILKVAKENHLPQDQLPANILIISDMEFDGLQDYWKYNRSVHDVDATLFETIAERYAEEGYKLPRLVFWNVASRTNTIPISENDLGVALVSGFSPSIADMVMSSELDPYKCLLKKLFNGRYVEVENALKE